MKNTLKNIIGDFDQLQVPFYFLVVESMYSEGHPYHLSFCMPSVPPCHDVTMAHGMRLAATNKNNLSVCHVPPLLAPYKNGVYCHYSRLSM